MFNLALLSFSDVFVNAAFIIFLMHLTLTTLWSILDFLCLINIFLHVYVALVFLHFLTNDFV